MLWIALYIPQLPLQLAQRASPTTRACIISDGPATRPLVRCANTAALQSGVKISMPVAAARALVSELVVCPYDCNLEAQALHNLCCWAAQFTPNVVLQSGAGLILEVSTTLQLHGGLKKLLKHICQGAVALGYQVVPGVAPTPLASWLLARARHKGLDVRMCTDGSLLTQRLESLPLALLDWPVDVLVSLHSLGVRRIGQCLKLPRDGLSRRFGQKLLLDLDRAVGTCPDPRQWFIQPEAFANRIDFGFDVNDAQALLFPLKRLLQEMEGFLRGRGAGVQQWHLLLDHWNHGKTRIPLNVLAPERSADRFLALARERLLQTTLMGPVLALGIAADHLLQFEESNKTLIADPGKQAIGWAHLVDKLCIRLGADKVYRLRTLDDHRPAHSWQQQSATNTVNATSTTAGKIVTAGKSAAAGKTAKPTKRATSEKNARSIKNASAINSAKTTKPATTAKSAMVESKAAASKSVSLSRAQRPLWLLKSPRTLLSSQGNPLCQGQLQMLAGPERIESGWWDGKPSRRDYYVARNTSGETFWIYREHRRSSAWYLHGIFS